MIRSLKPLRAYSVLEEDENTGGIVFARTNAHACRLGSQIYGDGDFHWGRAHRVPWADAYAPGPVPQMILLQHGWWLECHGCGQRIELDNDDCNPLEIGSAIYCRPSCRQDWIDRKYCEEICGSAAVQALSERLLQSYPDITIVHTHSYCRRIDSFYQPQQIIIDFTFPGSQFGRAIYRMDDGNAPELFVCQGDLNAWDRYVEKLHDHQ